MLGTFHNHRTPDAEARLRHIENFLSRIGAVPVSPAVQAKAAKNTGIAGGGVIGGAGGSSTPILFGDVTGPTNNTLAVQASGTFGIGSPVVAGWQSSVNISAPAVGGLVVQAVSAGVGAQTAPLFRLNDGNLFQVFTVDPNGLTGIGRTVDATAQVAIRSTDDAIVPLRIRGNSGTQSANLFDVQRASGVVVANIGPIGGFNLLAGDLAVAAGKQTTTFTDAVTANPTVMLTLTRHSTGTAAAGLGPEIHMDVQGSSGTDFTAGFMRALFAGGGLGAENSTFIWGCRKGGAEAEVLRFRGTLGSAVAGGVGGQFWCRTEALFSGTTLGLFNHTPGTQPGPYTVTNPTVNRSLDEAAATLTQLSQVVGTLIQDLQSFGAIG